MNHCYCGFIIFALQVLIETAQLAYKEHSLIHYRAARKRNNVCIIIALLKHTACYIKLSVKRQTAFYVFRAFNKALKYIRHTVSCSLSEYFRANRHFSPAEEFHSLFFHYNFKHLLCLTAFERIPGEEEHSDTVISRVFKLYAYFCRFRLKK